MGLYQPFRSNLSRLSNSSNESSPAIILPLMKKFRLILNLIRPRLKLIFRAKGLSDLRDEASTTARAQPLSFSSAP
jgi:hypothetical protein